MAQVKDRKLISVEPAAYRRDLGFVTYGLGSLVIWTTGLFPFILFNTSRWPAPAGGEWFFVLLILLVLLVLLSVAVILLIAAEGFLVPNFGDVCARDPRPPVLFLRPFEEDAEHTYDVIYVGESVAVITAKVEDFLTPVNAIGPLVSIGKPTRLSRLGIYPLGAFREYVTDDQWQSRVRGLLEKAGMVILAAGDSPGIEWEIDQVKKHFGRESLILYLPPRPVNVWTRKGRAKKERAAYQHFKTLIEQKLDLKLPPDLEAVHIIGFDNAGNPVLAPDAARKRWAYSEYDYAAKTVQAQLSAVLGKLHPEVDLRQFKIPGRATRWLRISVSFLLLLAGFGCGILMHLSLFNPFSLIFSVARFLQTLLYVTGWIRAIHVV